MVTYNCPSRLLRKYSDPADDSLSFQTRFSFVPTILQNTTATSEFFSGLLERGLLKSGPPPQAAPLRNWTLETTFDALSHLLFLGKRMNRAVLSPIIPTTQPPTLASETNSIAGASDGARNQSAAYHEGGRAADAERVGQSGRFVQILRNGTVLHVAPQPFDVQPNGAGDLDNLVIRRILRPPHHRNMKFVIKALPVRCHRCTRREPRRRAEDTGGDAQASLVVDRRADSTVVSQDVV